MISQFDRVNLKMLRPEINDALDAVGRRYGIKIEATGARFSPTTATFKLECTAQQNGSFVSKPEMNFQKYGQMFGLRPEDLGKTFVSAGMAYKIVGLNPNARKRPVICESAATGKQYVFPAAVVRLQLDHGSAA